MGGAASGVRTGQSRACRLSLAVPRLTTRRYRSRAAVMISTCEVAREPGNCQDQMVPLFSHRVPVMDIRGIAPEPRGQNRSPAGPGPATLPASQIAWWETCLGMKSTDRSILPADRIYPCSTLIGEAVG